MTYAARTQVAASASKAQIEALVIKRGAEAFAVMTDAKRMQVAFRLEGRNIVFRVERPAKPRDEQVRWRALLLVIKAKLESADAGIETLEEAFLGQVMLPDGHTVYETTRPMIAKNYEGGDVPLLPSP